MFGSFFSFLALIGCQINPWHFPLACLLRIRDNVVQLSTPRLPNVTQASGFLKKILHLFLISPTCASCPAHFMFIILYLGKCINFEILSPSVPSPARAISILLITLFSYFLRVHPFSRQTKFDTPSTEHCG